MRIGVDEATVFNWETGHYPSLRHLPDVLDCLVYGICPGRPVICLSSRISVSLKRMIHSA